MKNAICNAFLLLVLFAFMAACTEEISEEVQNKESVSNNANTAAQFQNKSIKLVSKMDEELSFYMHKAGTDDDCEIDSPTLGFEANDYSYADTNYAIDCVLDAEELDLYFNGVEFELQVDEFLCEYIAYRPYRILRWMPGATNRDVYRVECDPGCRAAAASSAYCDNLYDDHDNAAVIGGATFLTNLLGSDENLCYFDYASENEGSSSTIDFPNCDAGEVRTTIISLTGTLDDNGDGTADDPACNAFAQGDTTESDCGGKSYNCADGAAKEEFSDMQFVREIYANEDLESFTQSWSYKKMFGDDQYSSNMKLANFSRICADTSTTKNTDASFTGVSIIGSEVEDIRLARGNADGETFDTTQSERTVYAKNPYRSLISTYPYYGFFCLDKSFDVKAQIRLFIREWDRSFSDTNTFLNQVTDLPNYNEAAADNVNTNMDTRDTIQPNTGNDRWNDFDDLDDFFEDPANDGYNVGTDEIWDNGLCDDTTDAAYEFQEAAFPGTRF